MIPLISLSLSVRKLGKRTKELPRYYLDLGSIKATAKTLLPFTPPVNLMVALHTTRMMQAEGLESLFARHH